MLSSPSSSQSISLTLVPGELQIAGTSTGAARLLAQVRNTGSSPDLYTLEVKGLDPSWYTAGVGGGTLSLFPGDSLSCPIDVHPPGPDKAAPGLYPLEIRVRSQSDPASFAVAKGTLRILAAPVDVRLIPPRMQIAAGADPQTIIVRVSTAGDPTRTQAGQYTIEVRGLDPSWYTAEVNSIAIFPGDSAEVPIRVHPPMAARAGSYQFVVHAASDGDPSAAAEVESELAVAPGSLALALAPGDLKLVAGETPRSLTATVRNNSAAGGEYAITVDGIGSSWYALERDTLSLAPGSSAQVRLELHPPAEKNVPGRYSFTVRVHSTSDPALFAVETAAIELSARLVELKLAPSTFAFTPNEWPQSAQMTISLRNAGRTVEQYALQVDGLPPEWYTLETEAVAAFPGDSASVALKLHPPRSGAKAGRYTFTVHARSLSSTQMSASTTGALEVAPELDISLDIEPQRARGAQAMYKVTIRNRGNAQVQLQLAGHDPEGALTFSFDKAVPTVAAQSETTVAVMVAPHAPSKDPGERPQPFRISARPIGANPPEAANSSWTTTGEFVQLGATPPPQQPSARPALLAPAVPPTPAVPPAQTLYSPRQAPSAPSAPTAPAAPATPSVRYPPPVAAAPSPYVAPAVAPPRPGPAPVARKKRGRGLRVAATLLGLVALLGAGAGAAWLLWPRQSATVHLEAADFSGGYRHANGDPYRQLPAVWVYGPSTGYSTMRASFAIDGSPQGSATLTVYGMDSQDDPSSHVGKTHISIKVNDVEIYNGDNRLPDDFPGGDFVHGQGNWGTADWEIGPGILRQGQNTLSITNLEPNSAINRPPWFMLNYADVKWNK